VLQEITAIYIMKLWTILSDLKLDVGLSVCY